MAQNELAILVHVIKRFLLACTFGASMLLVSIPNLAVAQASPKLVAEGDYGVRPASGTPVPKIHWAISQLADGNLEVHIPQTFPSGLQTQRFRFTADFKPLGYTLEQKSARESSVITCTMAKDAITCDGEFRGHKSSSKLKMDKPYVFISTEFTTDFFWLTAATMSQVRRVPGQVTQVAVVALAERADDDVALEIPETQSVKFLSRKKYNSVFGSIECNVFEYNSSEVWVADSGVVIAVTSSDAEGSLELVALKDEAHRIIPVAKP